MTVYCLRSACRSSRWDDFRSDLSSHEVVLVRFLLQLNVITTGFWSPKCHCFERRVAQCLPDQLLHFTFWFPCFVDQTRPYFFKRTGCPVFADWFVWIGFQLLPLTAASEFQSFCQLAGRGDFKNLVYRTSTGFLDTTLAMHIGKRLSWRMISFDLVWRNFNPILWAR